MYIRICTKCHYFELKTTQREKNVTLYSFTSLPFFYTLIHWTVEFLLCVRKPQYLFTSAYHVSIQSIKISNRQKPKKILHAHIQIIYFQSCTLYKNIFILFAFHSCLRLSVIPELNLANKKANQVWKIEDRN